MKLKKWALMAEIVGGAAIVISLIVLIIEIRGNTAAVQAQTAAALFDSERERLFPLILNEGGLAELIVKSVGDEPLNEVERFQVARYYAFVLDTFEWQFGEVQAGRLQEDELEISLWQDFWDGQPGISQSFDRRRPNLDPAFAEFWEDNVINR